MRKGCRLAVAAFAFALVAAIAPTASAVVVHARNGHFFGIEPHRGISPAAVPGSIAAGQQPAARRNDNGTLSYQGGPVVHSSAPYLIFWTPSGESIATSSQMLMERYFTDVAADSGKTDDVYGVTRQYTDASGFADYRQTFDSATQALIDTQPYPATDSANCPDTTSAYPTCVTDAQIQQELERFIAAKGLPTDGPSTAGGLPQSAPIYFVVLPGDVNVCFAGECADNYFCAYHSNTTDGSDNLLYAAIPMMPAATGAKSCQYDGNSAVQEPNGDLADVVIDDISHEGNETLTDPLGTSWYDNISGNEEADDCAITGSFSPAQNTDPNAFLPTLGGDASAGTLYDQRINGHVYYTQSEWSNGDAAASGSSAGCQMQPTAGTITPSFTEPSGPNTVGSSLTFTNNSTSTNPISSETWSFGDGSTPVFHTGGLTNVSHTYTAAGTYTVTLTLVDDRGNIRSATRQITVDSVPVAAFSFSPSSPREGTPVSFDASASSDPNPSAAISSYSWKFGDGSAGSGEAPSHTYATRGTYTVTLTVKDSAGVSGATSRQVTVTDEPPTAAFTIGPGPYAVGQAVSFNGSSSNDPDGTITAYAWTFGDGTSGTGASPTHAYATGGPYTVTLTVSDSAGLSGTTTRQITVATPSLSPAALAPPRASFVVATPHPAARVPVKFSGASSAASAGSITSYAWSFGDGSTGDGAAPTHTYKTAGSYRVTLTVFASTGLVNTATRSVLVLAGSRITKASVDGKGGSRLLAITVNGPGTLVVGSRRFLVARARTIKVRLRPTAAQAARLRTHRHVTIKVPITFRPKVGARSVHRVVVTFTA